MRFARTFFLASLFLLLALPALSQQSAPAIQRDPQALAILNQSATYAGGLTALAAIRDYTEKGTITYLWAGEPQSASLSIFGRVPGTFRMDSILPSGTQSLIVSNGAGEFVRTDGTSTALPPYNVISGGVLGFPMGMVVSSLANPSVTISHVEQTTWGGVQVNHIRIIQPVDPSLPLSDLPHLGTFELFFSTSSHNLVGFSETVWSDQDIKRSYVREISFSNYSVVNGLSLPFTITERIGQVQTWTITLTSVSFNSGLSDSLFTL